MTNRGVLVTLVLVSGCAEEAADTFTSGARLKLSWFTFADGTVHPGAADVFDVERDEACTPVRWSDGHSYCTPPVATFTGHPTIYTSARCDDAVLYAGDDPGASYAATYAGGAIDALHRLEPVALAGFWLRDEAGACVGPYDGVGHRFHRTGAAVDRASLARVEPDAVVGDGRVAVQVVTSADGLRLPHGLRDASLGFDCLVRTTASGVATCLPPRPAALRFADAGCTEPVVGQHESWPDVAPYVFAGEVCDPRGFMVGVELTAAPGYELVDGACTATAAPIGHRWFQAGPIDLATVERRRVATSGRRLAPIELVADGVRLPDPSLFDSHSGEECRIAASPTEPGAHRCLPLGQGYLHTYYTDAGCSSPLDLANVYREAPLARCGAGVPRYAIGDRPGTYYRITASQTSPVYRRDASGACTAAPYEGLRERPALHQLGEQVPITEFIAATAARDP